MSDIKKGWEGGTTHEYNAIEYGIEKFHDFLIEKQEPENNT